MRATEVVEPIPRRWTVPFSWLLPSCAVPLRSVLSVGLPWRRAALCLSSWFGSGVFFDARQRGVPWLAEAVPRGLPNVFCDSGSGSLLGSAVVALRVC